MSAADNGGVIGALRRATLFTRATAVTVIVALGSLMAMPTVMAARSELERQDIEASLAPSKQQALSRQLSEAKHTLQRLRDAHEPSPTDAESTLRGTADALARLGTELEQSHHEMLAYYSRIRERLEHAQVSAEILKRHEKAVDQYTKRMERVLDKLDKAASRRAGSRGQLQAAIAGLKQLERHGEARGQHPFDPDNLPSKAVEPEHKREPRTTPGEFQADGLSSRPWPRFASHGDYRLDELAGADDPRWRAATTEVELSEAVEAKAAELDHDPVQIHAWVRNNVQWTPTWGAMQDATHTLSARRGNAFDIAGLEIALLRASDIPARYAVGTIEVEADRFANWAGGFDDVRAAADYASSGGIATTSLVEGGRIAAVRMEHVWVEAALDYLPSRAAVNRTADSWIPLDPSFKQYEFEDGIDVAAVTGIDPEQTAQSFLDSGTIDEQAGYVQGFDPTILQDTQADAESALEDYITNDLPDDATVRDVLGGRRIIEQTYETLPASIANTLVTTGVRYDALPEGLQHRIAFGLGTTITGQLRDPVEFAWPELNGERVTLSFRPATQADEDALKSLLPEGEITDPDQLPDSIPSHLVDVVPELRVGDEVVSSGSTLALGAEMDFGFTVTQRGIGSDTAVSPVSAGSYLAVAVAGGSVAPAKLEGLQTNIESTKAKLESGDDQQLASLTRGDLLGDLFHSGTLAYFGQLDALSRLQTRQQDALIGLAPSAGTYGYTPRVSTLFGTPNTIEPGGVTMDLDRIARTLGGPEDADTRARINTQIGALSSALEHGVPEQMFSTETERAEGVSAVKALAIANREGQRIYEITPENRDSVLPQIGHDQQVMDEIRVALNAGKTVTTHTSSITVPGWQGAGYVIQDPDTGSGAWKISGSLNGGVISWDDIATFLVGLFDSLVKNIAEVLDRSGFFSVIGKIGAVLSVISSFLAAIDVWDQTESVLATLIAGIGTFAIAMSLAFLATQIAGLVALTFSVASAIAVTVAITMLAVVLSAALNSFFVYLLKSARLLIPRVNEIRYASRPQPTYL